MDKTHSVEFTYKKKFLSEQVQIQQTDSIVSHLTSPRTRRQSHCMWKTIQRTIPCVNTRVISQRDAPSTIEAQQLKQISGQQRGADWQPHRHKARLFYALIRRGGHRTPPPFIEDYNLLSGLSISPYDFKGAVWNDVLRLIYVVSCWVNYIYHVNKPIK